MKNSIVAGGIIAAIIVLLLSAQSCCFIKFSDEVLEDINESMVINGSSIRIDTDFQKAGKTIEGEGNAVEQTFQAGEFKDLEINGSADLQIVHGNTVSVSVSVAESLAEYVSVTNTNGILEIRLDNRYRYTNANMDIRIVTPIIESVEVNGAADITMSDMGLMDLNIEINGSSEIDLNNIAAGKVGLEVNGAGKVNTKDLDCDSFDAEINGSGTIFLNGKANRTYVEVSGTGVVDVTELSCEKIDIDKNGLVKVKR